MRVALVTILWASTYLSKGSSLAPSSTFNRRRSSCHYPVDCLSLQTSSSQTLKSLYSTLEEQEVLLEQQLFTSVGVEIVSVPEEEEAVALQVTAPAINARLDQQLDNMKLKDQSSKQLTKEVGETK
jgi:hypothetical protein